jgi:hypothetical protein
LDLVCAVLKYRGVSAGISASQRLVPDGPSGASGTWAER